MKLRHMLVTPDEVIVRFKLTDLADIHHVYDLEVCSESQQELADAIRDVLLDSDDERFKYLCRRV